MNKKPRTREEIEEDVSILNSFSAKVILEVLLDIRDLLTDQTQLSMREASHPVDALLTFNPLEKEWTKEIKGENVSAHKGFNEHMRNL